MSEYILKRTYHQDRTTGIVQLKKGKVIHTLERPWKENQVGISCIPEGRYLIKRDKHGKHRWFKVMDVKGRTAIEWHEGHRPEHSEGCILNNLLELQDLMIETRGEDFYITIKS